LKNYVKLIISILIPLIIGFSGSFFTRGSISSWYVTIHKPSFNPPNWIFALVWTIMYIIIGFSFYFTWIKLPISQFKSQFYIFVIQLLLNFLWSVLFFGLKNPIAALADILLLWLSILLLIIAFYHISEISSYLLIPYLLWVTFASVLNYSIINMNR